jgi:uncharacterized membrane protein YgdD (TMEM256/DUF423 family)
VAGVLSFSGSLYALVLTGIRGLGAVTPFGGVAMMLGFLLLCLSRDTRPSPSAAA